MMNLAFILLFSVAANGAVHRLEPRQLGSLFSGAGASAAPSMKAFKIEEIKAKVPGAKRIKLIYGPYKLRAANSTTKIGNGISLDKGGTGYQNLVGDDFPKDVTVLEATSEVQDETFKRTDIKDGLYNHHNVFVNIGKASEQAYTCESVKPSNKRPFSVFMGGATEVGDVRYAATKGNVKTGYYLGKDRKMVNVVDVVNYNNVERTIYTSSEIEYLPGKPEGFIDTVQELIDPGTCGGQSGSRIHPPKGVQKFSINGTGIVVAHDGYILNIKGHLHDGGVNMALLINNKEVCNSKAAYGGEGHSSKTSDGIVWETIREMSTCEDPVKVSKGDKIYMQANYDLNLHPSREQGGMGAMGAMGAMRTTSDGDNGAEQMALFVTYFAPTGPV